MVIVECGTDEALGLFVWYSNSHHIIENINKELDIQSNIHEWYWKPITEAEFGTYQAFGFRVFEAPEGDIEYVAVVNLSFVGSLRKMVKKHK